MLVDNNKKQSLLETKEIYYYSIVGYAESDSAGTALVVGPYTLSIAHITSKIIKGL